MENLRRIRREKHMTMKQLGEKTGVTESAIGQYETGKRKPSYEMILKLSEALECSVADLMYEEDWPVELSKPNDWDDDVLEFEKELEIMKTKPETRGMLALYADLGPEGARVMRTFMESLKNGEYDTSD